MDPIKSTTETEGNASKDTLEVNNSDTGNKSIFPWWILLLLLIPLVAVGAYILMRDNSDLDDRVDIAAPTLVPTIGTGVSTTPVSITDAIEATSTPSMTITVTPAP